MGSSSSSVTTCTDRRGPRTSRRNSNCRYKPLLDDGVKFYASLGNHDAREQRYYKLFNMDGKLYYTFSPKPNIRFFALESTYPVPEQIQWLENELKASSSDWKIVFFITRCTRPAIGTAPTCAFETFSNRCS